jgi:copper chaperone CopZ
MNALIASQLVMALLVMLPAEPEPASGADKKAETPPPLKYQITGLFSPDREQDLRECVAQIPQIKLVNIDYKNAEIALQYDPAKVFPNSKPAEILQKLDNLVKSASNHTFGIKPLRTVPPEKLKLIEIPVAALDCKACALAAYEAVAKLDGVEQATVSFRDGRVTAWIDPDKTDRGKLEAALTKLGVQVKTSK